jgi:hypothetical protein
MFGIRLHGSGGLGMTRRELWLYASCAGRSDIVIGMEIGVRYVNHMVRNW